jgi:hypothetical protein
VSSWALARLSERYIERYIVRKPPVLRVPLRALLRVTLLRIDQDAGVQDGARVELRLGGTQRPGEGLGALAVVAGPVISADGVVVGDGAPSGQDGIARGGLQLGPLPKRVGASTL